SPFVMFHLPSAIRLWREGLLMILLLCQYVPSEEKRVIPVLSGIPALSAHSQSPTIAFRPASSFARCRSRWEHPSKERAAKRQTISTSLLIIWRDGKYWSRKSWSRKGHPPQVRALILG